MALPDGITTATIQFGKTFSFEGSPQVETVVVITPSHRILWDATGDYLSEFAIIQTAPAGAYGQFVLPHTDQPGFLDAKGDPITNWYYSVVVKERFEGVTKEYRKVFQVPTGTTLLDLDKVPIDGTVAPVGTVNTPDIISVAGIGGPAVGAQPLADALAPYLPSGGEGGGSGVPAGGTTDQVLKKNSATSGDASWSTLTAALVGLGNVNNTSDLGKPISTLTQAALDLKAPLASPTFSGTVSVPDQAPTDATNKAANTRFVAAAVAALVASSPAALDTIRELATALGDDPNFASTIMALLGEKAPLFSPVFTGNPTVPTAAAADNDTTVANTAWVRGAIDTYAMAEADVIAIKNLPPGSIVPVNTGGVQPLRNTITTRTDIRIQWEGLTTLADAKTVGNGFPGYAIAGDIFKLVGVAV